MNDLQGYSFSPGLQQRFRQSLNNTTGASQLPQNASQALQVLSLRLPSFLGGSPIAPDALLRPSHNFTPDAAVRSQTTGTGAPPPSAMQPPSSGAPSPAGTPMSVARPAPFMQNFDFGGGSGESAPSAPPSPTFEFGNPNNRTDNPATGTMPMPTAPGPSAQPNADHAPLINMLDAFLNRRV